MYDHDNIQLLTNSGPLSSPEHVVSIPLDIEENDTSPDINRSQNFEQQILFQNDSSDNGDRNDYNIIDTLFPPTESIHYDITPIHNYSRDTINAEDAENGWEKIENDEEPDHGPFLDTCGPNLNNDSHNPEDFFNNLFNKRMFTIMVDATNYYAQQKFVPFLETGMLSNNLNIIAIEDMLD